MSEGGAHDGAEERDPYLRQALRHAPDADVAPPAPLSAAILREARRASTSTAAPASTAKGRQGVATAPTADVPQRAQPSALARAVQGVWAWLARPSAAAAFASVLAATLVGLLWWDRPIDFGRGADESTPPTAAAPADVSPASRAASASTTTTVDATAAVDATPAALPGPKAAEDEPRRAAGQLSRPSTAPVRRSAPLQPSTPGDAAVVEGKRRPPAARTPAGIDGGDPSSPGADTRASTAEGAPSADSAPKAAVLPGPARDDTAGPRQMQSGPPGSADRRSVRATQPTTAAAPPVAADALPTVRPAVPPAGDPSRDARTQVTGLMAAIESEPARWQWQRDDLPPQPMTPAFQAWLSRLNQALAASPAGGAAPASGTDDAATATQASTAIRLWREGSPHTSVRIDADRLAVRAAGARSQAFIAPLGRDAAASLKASLADVSR